MKSSQLNSKITFQRVALIIILLLALFIVLQSCSSREDSQITTMPKTIPIEHFLRQPPRNDLRHAHLPFDLESLDIASISRTCFDGPQGQVLMEISERFNIYLENKFPNGVTWSLTAQQQAKTNEKYVQSLLKNKFTIIESPWQHRLQTLINDLKSMTPGMGAHPPYSIYREDKKSGRLF